MPTHRHLKLMLAIVAGLVLASLLCTPRPARGDGLDGPIVTAAGQALEKSPARGHEVEPAAATPDE